MSAKWDRAYVRDSVAVPSARTSCNFDGVTAGGVEDRTEIVLSIGVVLLLIALGVGGILLLLFLVISAADIAGRAGRVLPDWFKDKFLTLCGVAGLIGLIFAYVYSSASILIWSLVGIGLFFIAVLIGMNE